MDQKIILIVDDDEDILETVGALLEYEGFKIHCADNVEEGIGMIDTVKPDLVLLDVMFPEKKTRGFEAAKEIKGKYPDLPVFVFTAINREYAFDFNKADIIADEFINKPVETDKLIAMIRKHLK